MYKRIFTGATFCFPGLLIPNLVEVTKLPEKHQQLLVELDLLGGVWKVSLSQRVGQQSRQALQDKVKVLQIEIRKEI